MTTMQGTTPTSHELDILAAYVLYGTAKATAYELGLTMQTVKNTLNIIRRRLGVTNTTQAVAVAISRGYMRVG